MQERSFIRGGKTLLSGIEPVRRAERLADAVSIKDKTLYFCPSPLYGYGLARLLSRLDAEAPNSAVLCVEADSELYELTEKNIDSSAAAHKSLRITNIRDAGGLCAFVREAWGARAFRRIEILRFSGGWQLFPELYDYLCEALRREIATDWSNALTMTKLGRLYIHNVLRNIPLLGSYPSIAGLSFGEKPVLVMGAGPSLDETLEALEKHFSGTLRNANRPFKIVCVDTCLGALKDRNISPDLAVILESQHWNLRDFIGCRGWEVPAVFDLSSLPASNRLLAGERYIFFTPWTQLRIFERLKQSGLLPAIVPPLGSVGITAVELSRRLTRGKIICAGLDFSFTPDKFHARSTPGHRGALNNKTRFRGIANAAAYDASASAAVSKSGVPVHSSPVLKYYRDLFEREFGGSDAGTGDSSRVFDIEGSGLALGLKTLSMNEAMNLLEINTSESLSSFSPRPSVTNHDMMYHELTAFFNNEREMLIRLRDILTGDAVMNKERLNYLIDECDYLWAHFPDCAANGRPALADTAAGITAGSALSFLNRVRMEIESALKILS